MRLTAVKDRIGVPPDDPLLAATEHALRQWNEIRASSPRQPINSTTTRSRRITPLHIPDSTQADNRIPLRSPTAAALYHSLQSPAIAAAVRNVFDYSATSSTGVPHGAPNTPIEKIPRPATRPLETLTKIAAQNLDGYLFRIYLLSRTVVHHGLIRGGNS